MLFVLKNSIASSIADCVCETRLLCLDRLAFRRSLERAVGATRARYSGLVQIPEHAFTDSFTGFCFATLRVRPEAILALQKVVFECWCWTPFHVNGAQLYKGHLSMVRKYI